MSSLSVLKEKSILDQIVAPKNQDQIESRDSKRFPRLMDKYLSLLKVYFLITKLGFKQKSIQNLNVNCRTTAIELLLKSNGHRLKCKIN